MRCARLTARGSRKPHTSFISVKRSITQPRLRRAAQRDSSIPKRRPEPHRDAINYPPLPNAAPMAQAKLFDDELHEAMQQLFDETIEAIQLAKVSPDLDDLAATFAVAL